MRSSFHYYPVKPPYLEGILLLTFQRHLVTLRKDVACQDKQDQAKSSKISIFVKMIQNDLSHNATLSKYVG